MHMLHLPFGIQCLSDISQSFYSPKTNGIFMNALANAPDDVCDFDTDSSYDRDIE